MCGIFAYSGSSNVTHVLVEGLKKLEYRGYDSSGVAFFSNENKVQCLRSSGDISGLEKLLFQKNYDGHLGIGHTRWATHGAPTQENAHPHKAGSLYVIHNGVIENEEEIKHLIDSKQLYSETDTEVMAHLLYRFYKEEKGDFLKGVLKTMDCLKGSYAVVALCDEKPKEMVAFKQGPPLILCKGKEGLFVSSDVYAVNESVREALFLEDGEILHLKGNTFKIYNSKGKEVQKKFEIIEKNESLSDKKSFPHFMLKEIFDQPVAAQKAMEAHINKSDKTLDFKVKGDAEEFRQLIKESSHILIIACGSSYFAGLFAKYFIEDMSSLKADVEMASEFIYRKAIIPKGTFVLIVSQSGETADSLKALKKVKEKGLKVISLCNVSGSHMDRQSDYRLYMGAGMEVAVASTKSFTSSLIVLSLLALYFRKVKDAFPLEEEQSFIKNFLLLPSHMEEVLNYNDFFMQTGEVFKSFSGFFYLGRGVYYPIALEGALKLKEVAYLHAEGYPSGELKHGPLALIDKNMVAVFLIPSQKVLYEKTLTNLKEIHSRGASIVGIGEEKTAEVSELCDHFLPLPKNSLSPILACIPLQIMAYYISRSYGYNADRPRNLAKSVTVE